MNSSSVLAALQHYRSRMTGTDMAPLDQGTTDIHARRFDGIRRDHTPADVERLRGSVRIEHTLAGLGARRLWELLHSRDYVNALGATSGNQAIQMVRAGLEAIYLSGWQVAADANTRSEEHTSELQSLMRT